MGKRVLVSFAILWVLGMPQAGQAQVLYGSIVGNVKDASDAVVVGARVVITHGETKQSREETTNVMGGYSFPTLPPGTYGLRVTKEGFATFTQTGVFVTVNNVSRIDVSLNVGAVTESVTVIGLAAALQTDRAEVRTEMSSAQVEALPTSLGRNYQQLLVMVPGFSPPRNENSVPSNPSRALGFNVNGMSYSINSTRIDGAQSINVWLPHEAAYVPTLESIETVTTATNSFDAETGLAGGAAIYVQTKGGTNEVHGAVFQNHSNQHLKAKPFFIPPGAVKPKLVYNEFGGAVGGPIKREKLFYFVSFERTNDREAAALYTTVPTAAIKSGNMSGSSNPIYDPLTGDATGAGRTPLPDKLVPASRISRITRTLSDKTPLPNVPGDPLTQNYYATASYVFDRNRLDAKANWNAGKLTMFGRLGFLRYNMSNPPAFGETGGPETSSAGGNPGTGWGDTYTVTVAGTYLITQRFIVDAYFGWTSLGTNIDTPGVEEQQGLKLGIPGTNGPARYQGGWPKFSVSNYDDLGTPGAYLPYYRTDPSKNYVANFNWVKGSHDIRFGVDVSYQAMNHIQAEGGAGIGAGMGGFTFTGGPTIVRGGPTSNQFNSYATFLLGLPTSVGKNVITSKDDKVTTRAWQYSSYFRDRWNLTPALTLSLGVRWEYFPVPTRAETGLGFYDFQNNTVRVCGYGSVPDGCGVDVGKFRLLPRVGVAYRASRTFVIRAGYGITNDPWSLSRGFRTNYPAMLSLAYEGANSYQPFGRIEDGIPAVQIPDLANGIVAVPRTYAVNSLPQKFKRGYIQSWNFTLQKELRYGFTAQAGYVATRSVATMSPVDLNAGQVPGLGNAGRPLFGKFGRTTTSQMIMPVGTNMYDSLQSRLERRFSQGLQLGAAYTWSKVIGYTQDSGSPSVQALPYFALNRVVRGFDRTHNLQITGMWELPFGQKKRFAANSRTASAILGGWRINTLASFMSGTPFTVSSSGTSLDMPGSSQRADLVKSEVKILGGAGRGQSFFDPFAFTAVREARFGTAGFNRLRGPGIVNWNFGLARAFSLTERVGLQFKMEAFNFSNTPHFSNPGGNVSNMVQNADGTIRNLGGYTEITGVTNTGRDGIDERMFRFGLRISF
ncbi:MAG: TonB-dependent receptor [Acidobacteriota bacterium]